MPEIREPLNALRHAVEASPWVGRYFSSERKQQTSQVRVENAVNHLHNTIETFRPDFNYFIDVQRNNLRELNANPSAEGLNAAIETYELTNTEIGRIQALNERLGHEFFTLPSVQEYQQGLQHSLNQSWESLQDTWSEIGLDEQTIETLAEQNPAIRNYAELLRPSPPSQRTAQQQPRQDTEQSGKEADPRQANYITLCNQIVAGDLPPAEKLDKSTQMFNAITYQRGTAAAQYGLTTEQFFEQRNDLPPGTINRTLETGKRFLQQADPPPALSASPQYTWKEATDIVVTAFDKFHPEMGEMARMALADGWVHAKPSATKFSNAYSSGTLKTSVHPSNHPYLQLNFDGTQYALETLAHEMGHAAVQYLEGEQGNRGLTNAPLHETFAHFAATLAIDEAIERAPSAEEKQQRAAYEQHRIHGLFSSSTKIVRFEQQLHQQAREQNYEPLNAENIADIVRDTYDRPAPQDPKMRAAENERAVTNMANIIHLAHQEPHYYASYPLAELTAQSLFRQYQEEGRGFADKWVDVMRNGAQASYSKTTDYMGVDTGAEALLQPVLERNGHLDDVAKGNTPFQSSLKKIAKSQDLKSAISNISHFLKNNEAGKSQEPAATPPKKHTERQR